MFLSCRYGFMIIALITVITESQSDGQTTEKGSGTIQNTQDDCVTNIDKIPDNMGKYKYLRNIQNTDEDRFYSCLIRDVNKMLPIVYTPVVGEACQKYGLVGEPKRGLTISIKDKGTIEQKLRSWPEKGVKAIVVTDGERILGLGDLGANGMGIPVGKMAIYTALGGIHPKHCLPVTLDVGTNNQGLLDGELYVGLKQKRVSGKEYDDLVDEFMTAVVKVFGKHTLVQFEDFANKNAFKFLSKYRNQYTMFNDDIQGTAAVALAGVLAAERFTGKKLADSTVLFVGAGEAGVGIANLMATAIGGDPKKAREKIYMKRSTKLIVKEDEKNYEDHDDRKFFCHEVPKDANIHDLLQIIEWMKPNILIGVSGQGGVFTKEVLEAMAKYNTNPIIFPLSNPTDKSECTAKEAYTYTQGKCLFASGSPFDPVEVNGKLRKPQQCNNAYIFPGVALAITTAQMTTVPDKVFLIAAETLANKCTTGEDFERGSLFPTLDRLRDCSVEIATEIVKYAFQNNLSALKERPADVKTYILSHHYDPLK